MQMYILSRQWGITLVSEQQMIGVQSQDMHAPGPDQPRRMHRKGVYGRIRRVEAQLGHGRAWWTLVCLVLLTQFGWMLWASPHHIAANQGLLPLVTGHSATVSCSAPASHIFGGTAA